MQVTIVTFALIDKVNGTCNFTGKELSPNNFLDSSLDNKESSFCNKLFPFDKNSRTGRKFYEKNFNGIFQNNFLTLTLRGNFLVNQIEP